MTKPEDPQKYVQNILDEQDGSPQIIVLDDEESIRSGCKKALEGEGLEVDVAADGVQGWEMLNRKEYDLALVDLRMPGLDGISVLERMQDAMPDVVTIVITGYASFETAVETVKLGAYDYIPKPFTPEELRNVVNRGLERRFLQLANRRLREERERNLLTLTEERSRLITVLNAMSDGVLVINRSGQLVLFNPSALHWVLKDRQVNEEQPPVALEEAVREEALLQLVEAIEQDEQLDQQDVELEIDGERFIHAAGAAVRDENDRYLGVVIVLRDITERKEIEKMKTALVRTVSHELRSPLAAVEGYLNYLDDEDQDPSERSHMVHRCRERIQGLQQTINDLLDLSRLESGQVHRELRKHNLTDILDEIVQLQKGVAAERNISIDLHAPEDLPVLADKRELSEIFGNLISNAIKYNQDDGQVWVKAGSDGEYIVVEVSDTGIGIKPEALDSIFDEFYRVRGRQTAKISGSGLGLAIVKRLVEQYQGRILVESELGEGSTFEVNLPIRP